MYGGFLLSKKYIFPSSKKRGIFYRYIFPISRFPLKIGVFVEKFAFK